MQNETSSSKPTGRALSFSPENQPQPRGLPLREPLYCYHRPPEATPGYGLCCGSGISQGPAPRGLHPQVRPGEAPVSLTPFPLLPPCAGLKAASRASATRANPQRAKKPSTCHTDQDSGHESRRDRLAQASGSELAGTAVQGQMAQGPHRVGMGCGWGEAGPSGLAR